MNSQRSSSFLALLAGLSVGGLSVGPSAFTPAHAGARLALGTADLDRMGVATAHPQRVTRMEIASGPAEVVIPPAQQAIVGATVSGVVSRLLVAEGEAVVAGQLMAEIQSPDLLRLQREYVDALVVRDLTQAQLRRDFGLREDGIIAERRLEETAAAARGAVVALDQSGQHLRLAGMTDEQIATLTERRELTSALRVRAPFDSIVVEQLGGLGAHVEPLDPVFRVADLTRLWLEVHVPQQRAEGVAAGMQTVVSVRGRELVAGVIHVGQVVDSPTQTVMVRASIDNGGLVLRAGQFLPARIYQPVTAADSIVAVPTSAVTRSGEECFVFVRTGTGFDVRPIEPLLDDGERLYVAAGIDESADVAIAGVTGLKALWLAGATEGDQ